MDIERFGHPSNFDAGPMESGLKYWAKLPALTAQMRGYNTFVKHIRDGHSSDETQKYFW
jgi:hypothetical protein